MNVSAPFIARPVATSLLAIALLLVGWWGYRLLPVAALPQVDFPTIQVTTRLPGASAETISALVTAPLERQFGLIAGLTDMQATSSEGLSAITLQFDLDKNIDIASEDVQAAINAARGVLPSGLPYPPSYSKVNPADLPIVVLSLTSENLPMTEVNRAADTLLAQKLSQISGVGRVLTEGGQRPAYRLQIDPARLAGYGLGMVDVRNALMRANVNLPKGKLEGPSQSLAINVNDQIADIETYRQLIVTMHDGNPVRLRDVGDVVEGIENTRAGGWVNGKPAVIVSVQRQPGANIVATVGRIHQNLPMLTSSLPPGMKLEVLSDRTETIRTSVHDVQFTMVITIVLVIGVIYLFLGSLRATIIPGVALPLSLVGTFGVMALCGFSLDNLSLMALTIAAGFVVDDAIVMIENIVRHVEKGEKPLDAAFKGAKEIGFTIISLTVSLVAVFIPLLFMSGIVGRLFQEFALTLSIAVLVSAVVSLTLTPMMCGRMLKHEEHKTFGKDAFDALLKRYETSLAWVLEHQRLTLLTLFATVAATIAMYVLMPKGFLPQQDIGQIEVTTDAPESVSFQEMIRLQHEVAKVIYEDEAVSSVTSILGVGEMNATPNTGHLTAMLHPLGKRDGIVRVMDRLNAKLAEIPGVVSHLQPSQEIKLGTRRSRTQYQYTLSDLNTAELAEWTPKLLEKLKSLPALADVASDQQPNGLSLEITIDRDQAARLGVQAQTVDDALYDAFGQRQISTVYSQVNQYRVILEATPEFQQSPESLTKLYVKASTGKLVPLGAFATVAQVKAPLSITHQGGFPAATISFNLAPGYSLSAATNAIDAAQAEMGMPDTIAGAYGGDAAEFQQALSSQPLLILAAVIVIYIVLGVLYESTIHPITILSTLPSAGVGALLALFVTGHDLSLVGIIGIVLLMGIVKKNAIMMIDFALEAEREEKLSPQEAIFKASLLRFRPIMMTTMAALLGALPLAFDFGIGGELRRPLGISIVGGLLVSQLLTLYTTPVIYLALDRLRARFSGSEP